MSVRRHWPILGDRCCCWDCRVKRGLPGRPVESLAEAERRCRDFTRASSLCVCESCATEFADHPADEVDEFLTVLCDGSRVKL